MKPLLLIFGLFWANGLLAEQLTVATDEWEGYASKEGKGYYMDLMRAVYDKPDSTVKFTVVPYARSLAMVKDGQADAALGLYFGEIPDKHMAAYIVEQDLVDVLLPADIAKAWNGMKTLEGKKVLAKIGYSFDSVTDVKMKYSEKASLSSMLKMMTAGRADAVLDYRADLEPLLKKEGLTQDQFTIINSVLSSPLYFAFADTPRGNAAKDHFEKRFKELFESGEIKKMMERNLGHANGLPKTLQSWK